MAVAAALCAALTIAAQTPSTPSACGPVPTANQLRWQQMEMYAFIHYSLNTYTDQEWGYGNEDRSCSTPPISTAASGHASASSASKASRPSFFIFVIGWVVGLCLYGYTFHGWKRRRWK